MRIACSAAVSITSIPRGLRRLGQQQLLLLLLLFLLLQCTRAHEWRERLQVSHIQRRCVSKSHVQCCRQRVARAM